MKTKVLVSSIFTIMIGLMLSWTTHAAPITNPNELLKADEAFQFSVENKPNQVITLTWQIEEGYQLYREQMRILDATHRKSLMKYSDLPKGTPKYDEVLGAYHVYENMQIINLMWRQEIVEKGLLIHYQGCADSGYCYPPIIKKVDLSADGNVVITDYDGPLYLSKETPKKTSTTSAVLQLFDKSLPLMLLSFLGLGILLTFTPCVLPMVPIVFSMIVGRKAASLSRALLLTTIYVLTMASTYAVAGVIAASLGYSIQAQFQSAYFIVPLVAILSLLALMQFGIVEMSALTKLNQRLNGFGQNRQGSIVGAFILGFVSALIISPCVTPAFVGALAYIGQQAQPIIGGLALFSLGLGMGAALFAVAILGSTVLPKTGSWMNTVRNATGVLLVALIIWLLERILAPSVTLFLWGLFILLVGVYIGAFDSKRERTDWLNFWRGIGVLLAIFGTLLMISSFSRSSHLASPFVNWLGTQAKPLSSHANFEHVETEAELNKMIKLGKSKNDYSIVYFTASWCTYCKKINTLFASPEIESKTIGLNRVMVDVSRYTLEQRSIMQQWRVFAPPVIMFLTPDGKEIQDFRLIGDLNDDQLAKHLEQFLDEFPSAKP